MSFLAPLFLLGALAVAAPIVFHLIRRTTREVTPFSSLMFLQPTPPRVTRRSRLENLWLLLLRCLVIALLAFGFARPFLPQADSSSAPAAGEGKRTVILIDASASLRREKLWDDSRRSAGELLRKAAPGDEFALLVFDRGARPVVTFEEWNAALPAERATIATQRLAALTPGWAATQLDDALLRAAELLDAPAADQPRVRQIVVISDFQEGARIDGLQGYEWPRGLEVVLLPVKAQRGGNASVHWIAEGDEAAPAKDDAPLRLRVVNAPESRGEQFALRWSGAAAAPAIDLYAPAGQSRIVRAPQPPTAGENAALQLTGDDTEFDNALFVLPPQTAQVPVLFLGADADDDPRASLYYLRRAFPKTARQSVEITAHRSAEAVPATLLQRAQMLILGDAVPDAALASARQFASEGRIVVAPLTSTASAQTIARLLEIPQLSAAEAPVKDYALLAQIDFQHPLFAPLADPRFSDFTKIHFWKYRRLDLAPLPAAKVVARFDSGDPALVQVPLGRGSVAIFASSWRPADSQLALSSKFVPLLHALLEQSSNVPAQKAQYFVGDEVPLPPGEQPFTIRKPDGSEVAVAVGGKITATDQPGLYAVAPGSQRFVVNLAPEESRLAPLPPERFTALGVPLRSAAPAPSPQTAAATRAHAQAAEIESRQKMWRWLVAVALGVLLLETLIAGRLSRLSPTAAQT